MAGPVTGGPVDLPHLPYSVYTYGPDGFARERPVGRNPNIMGSPFPSSTLFLPLHFFHSRIP